MSYSELVSTFSWIQHHPHVMTVIALVVWTVNNVVTALISLLPAPTKTSSPEYIRCFRVLNQIVGNIRRARSTAIESSPNFRDALKKHLESENGDHVFISRRLAHRAHNRLQLILGAIAVGKLELATDTAKELSQLLARHTESLEEEQARKKREDDEG